MTTPDKIAALEKVRDYSYYFTLRVYEKMIDDDLITSDEYVWLEASTATTSAIETAIEETITKEIKELEG